MKILALSDLYWTQESKSINIDDVHKMSFNQILNCPNLNCVKNYFKIIKALEPNLVLFCGDISGDGFCGTGFSSAIISLLRLLEIKKIKARYISGNHVLPEFYNQINDFFHSSKYIKELTLHPEDIDGFLFAGLSYNQSRN